MSTRLHVAPSRPTCRSSNRRAFTWRSISRRRHCSVCLCRMCSSLGPTRCANEAAGFHHAARRRGGGVASRGAGAASVAPGSTSRRRHDAHRPITLETQINILTVNLLFSTIVFAIAAKLYLLPMLPRLEPRSVVIPILLLHALRHLGLMFLAPGAVLPGLPEQFAKPAAFGDLFAAILALVALAAVVPRSCLARPL